MLVVVNAPGEPVYRIPIPVWHLELFWDDPEAYLAPYLANLHEDSEWEVVG